jgi:GNAT superfamily N-acetyltransferase
MADFELGGYRPGALAAVVKLHIDYYSANWDFGVHFETLVAYDLAEILRRQNPERDLFSIATIDGAIVGSITIDGLHGRDEQGQGAKLRFFILSEAARGKGIGNALMRAALEHCRRAGFKRISLWTFAGLHSARHLYEKYGFKLVEEREAAQWGKTVTEQRFVLEL